MVTFMLTVKLPYLVLEQMWEVTPLSTYELMPINILVYYVLLFPLYFPHTATLIMQSRG